MIHLFEVFLLLSIAALVIYNIFPTIRLKFIFSRLNERSIGFLTLFKTLLVTGAANVITPFRAGTLFTRPLILKKMCGTPLKKSYAGTVIEQMTEATIEAIIFFTAIYFISFQGLSFDVVTALSLLSIFGLLFLFYSRKMVIVSEKAMNLSQRILPGIVIRKIKKKGTIKKSSILGLIEYIQTPEKRARDVSMIVLSSLAVLLFSPVPMYFLFKAMSFDISYTACFFVFWASVFLGRISGVPGGLGVREGSMIFMLTSLGQPLEISVQATILFRTLSVGVALVLGVAASISFGVPILKRKNGGEAK